MKLAIMQPYLFPYIGYYSLIKNTDYFIFFDTPQYIRKGWINRNRIIGGNKEPVYFGVPVEKCERETAIKDVKIADDKQWKDKILGQLTVYKKRAPYYNDVISLVKDVVSDESGSISELAIKSIVKSCEFMNLDLKSSVYSEMNLKDIKVKEPDEWALEITKELKYDTYVNPPGGKTFFDGDKYKEAGIKLEFLSQDLVAYNQRIHTFLPGLSMIDILMFCKPEEVMEMMESYKLERG